MKKVFLIFLVVLMALALVACKQEQEDNGGGGSSATAEMPIAKSEGQAALVEQGASAKNIDNTGFRIKLCVTEYDADNGTITSAIDIGGLSDIYWIGTDEDNDGTVDEYNYFKDIDDQAYYYSSEYNKLLNLSIVSMTGSVKDNIFGKLVDAMLYRTYNTAILNYCVQGDDDTIDGVDCSTYTATIPSYYGMESASLKFWVNKEFGFTMKITYDGNDSFSYTMTSCKLKDADTEGLASYAAIADLDSDDIIASLEAYTEYIASLE